MHMCAEPALYRYWYSGAQIILGNVASPGRPHLVYPFQGSTKSLSNGATLGRATRPYDHDQASTLKSLPIGRL